VHNFGKQTKIILQKYDELTEPDIEIRLAKAELWYCLEFEMTLTPLDFFVRRTGRLYFDIKSITKLESMVLKQFSSFFNWTKEIENIHKKNIGIAINEVIAFKKEMQ